MNVTIAALAFTVALGPLPPTIAPIAIPSTARSPAPAHDGRSFDSAIVVDAATEEQGAKAEREYLAAHPCGSNGRWRSSSQHLVRHQRIAYEVLVAACSDGSATRTFYFDIHKFAGKTGANR